MAFVGGEVDVSVVDGLEEVEGLGVAFEGVECEDLQGQEGTEESLSEPFSPPRADSEREQFKQQHQSFIIGGESRSTRQSPRRTPLGSDSRKCEVKQP